MAQMEYPTWTKCNDGWKVRIPADLYENYSEAGELEFPVMKKSGEIKRVNISKVSKPFTLDGKEYVLGTPPPNAPSVAHTSAAPPLTVARNAAEGTTCIRHTT